jgi:hypothetical protein
MAAIECKLAICISRLVKFVLLLELKIEQKHGTSLHTPCYKDVSPSVRGQSVCPLLTSIPVILGEYRTQLYSELALKWFYAIARRKNCIWVRGRETRWSILYIYSNIGLMFGHFESECSIQQNACRTGIYAIARREKCICNGGFGCSNANDECNL